MVPSKSLVLSLFFLLYLYYYSGLFSFTDNYCNEAASLNFTGFSPVCATRLTNTCITKAEILKTKKKFVAMFVGLDEKADRQTESEFFG